MTKRYDEEFKTQAVELMNEIGAKATEARLGVSVKTLYSWRQTKRIHEGSQSKRSDEELSAANRRLERENEELRQANTILKKAMGLVTQGTLSQGTTQGFFAKG